MQGLILGALKGVANGEEAAAAAAKLLQARAYLGVSRQEHWSGLPFPSPMPESEKSK